MQALHIHAGILAAMMEMLHDGIVIMYTLSSPPPPALSPHFSSHTPI